MMDEHIALVAGGMEIRRWSRYEVDSDLLTPADAFSLAVDGFTKDDRERLALGTPCMLLINDQVQLTGTVEETTAIRGESGRELELVGRDLAAPLVDCSAPSGSYAKRTLLSVAEEMAKPWDILAVGDDSGERLAAAGRPDAARSAASFALSAGRARRNDWTVQAGETIWAFLSRGASRAGLVLWMSPGGYLVLARPCYDQEVLYELIHSESGRGNNVLSARRRRSWLQRHSQITGIAVSGRGTVRHRAQVNDEELDSASLYRPLTVTIDAATQKELRTKLERRQAQGVWESDSLEYTVKGHSQDGVVWQQDTLAMVRDEVLGVDEPMYVVGRKFTLSTEKGPRTTLRLRRPGVWLA